MMTRVVHAVVLALLVAGSVGLPAGAAMAEGEVDTTPPQVRLDPCSGATSCQRVRAEVFGHLEEGDDLAVLGARIGDQVVAEHVYDDGSGFVPEGSFPPTAATSSSRSTTR